uniref:Uncharacterized protein n=1 Tax=Rhizophora mucronata TaxID=61149 RepID=A0A2P2J2Z4_RHIMU
MKRIDQFFFFLILLGKIASDCHHMLLIECSEKLEIL